jgi:hypothetical protein
MYRREDYRFMCNLTYKDEKTLDALGAADSV